MTDVVEVEVLPVGDAGDGAADDLVDAGVALRVHPVGQAGGHLLDDLEAVDHGGGADLDGAGAQRHELGGVAPGLDAADGGDRQAARRRACGRSRPPCSARSASPPRRNSRRGWRSRRWRGTGSWRRGRRP